MLDKQKAVLVVVDVQGKLATLMYESERLFANVNRMIDGARALGIPVIYTEQLPDKLGPTVPQVKEHLHDIEPYIKRTFSCCGDPNFVAALKDTGRTQIFLVGIETHVCVYQTAVDLIEDGLYQVYLVQDAVSSRIDYNYHLGVQRIKETGAILTSVEMALFEMLEVAEGESFKKIIQIVK